MRIGHFSDDPTDEPWAGIALDDGTVVNIAEAGQLAGFSLPSHLRGILEEWEWQSKLELIAEFADETGSALYEREDLRQHAPIRQPDKIVCVGLNYREHVEEGGRDIPENPVLFAKFPNTIIGPEDEIVWDPSETEKVDYEAELVVVIGEEIKDLEPENAREAIAGYTVGNDVSARDLQHGDGQWVRGKSLDTFAPIGPELVTTDEVDDPESLEIYTEVNGERLQESSTNKLIFGIDYLISFISKTSTLYPGDLIFTGTPPGVGVYREPPVLLAEGDSVTVSVESIGTLTNDCQFE